MCAYAVQYSFLGLPPGPQFFAADMSFAILDNGDMEGQGAEHANCTKCLLWICSMLTSSVAMCHSLTVQTPPSKLSGEIAARKFIEEGANLGNSANLRHSCKSRAKGQAVLREIDLEEAPTNAWPDEGSARGPRPEVPRSASTQSSSMMASCCLRPQLQRCIRRIHFEDVGRAVLVTLGRGCHTLAACKLTYAGLARQKI